MKKMGKGSMKKMSKGSTSVIKTNTGSGSGVMSAKMTINTTAPADSKMSQKKAPSALK